MATDAINKQIQELSAYKAHLTNWAKSNQCTEITKKIMLKEVECIDFALSQLDVLKSNLRNKFKD